MLTRFGVEHGARMAEAMTSRLAWDSDAELHGAGALLHTLQGFIRLAPGDDAPRLRGATLLSSYEAEQHLLHLGRADEAGLLDARRHRERLHDPGDGRGRSHVMSRIGASAGAATSAA